MKHKSPINDIINNPLNATIICVLAENEIVLPKSEIQLFEERFRLLMGHYDIGKGIKRIKSNMSQLEILSRKLAFYFHEHNMREEHKDKIIKIAKIIRKDALSAERIALTVNELIDPCNILLPMSKDGKFGFGHLRFQEYLAATEIAQNREIDILNLMKQPSWHDVFLLFGNIYTSLQWLYEYIVMTNSTYISDNGVLIELIESRPIEEQKILKSIIQKKPKTIKYKDVGEDLLKHSILF